jgi:hypothetical protein
MEKEQIFTRREARQVLNTHGIELDFKDPRTPEQFLVELIQLIEPLNCSLENSGVQNPTIMEAIETYRHRDSSGDKCPYFA